MFRSAHHPRSWSRQSPPQERRWLGEGIGSVTVAPFAVTLTMCVTVKANAQKEDQVWGEDVHADLWVALLCGIGTGWWQRLEDSRRNALVGTSRIPRTFEGGVRIQSPCMSVQFLSARRCAFEHCPSCCPSRDMTMVVQMKKKMPAQNTAYHFTKKIFSWSITKPEAKCSVTKGCSLVADSESTSSQ